MTVTTERDCLRHRVVAIEADSRIVRVACGLRVAVTGKRRCSAAATRPCPDEPSRT